MVYWFIEHYYKRLLNLCNISLSKINVNVYLKNKNEHEEVVSKEDFIKHLKTPPKCTHIRVNPIATNKINMRDEINTALFKVTIL